MGLEFLILGPLEVRRAGLRLDLGPPKRRTLLAALLVHANEVVSPERLVECLWHSEAPATARAVLQNHVHGLRELLGADRVDRVGQGYRLVVMDGELDSVRFLELVERARPPDVATRAALLREALACWRGDPLTGTPIDGDVLLELDHLAELRLVALERLLETDVELGRSAEIVPELEALVASHPLREGLWRLLMLALHHSGRDADALDAYRRAHRTLVDEVGLEPGPALRELQRKILVGDVPSADDFVDRGAALLPMDRRERARALVGYATTIARRGDLPRAEAAFRKASQDAAAADDRVAAAQAGLRLAQTQMYRQTIGLREYLAHAQEAAAAADEAGDDGALAEALRAQGHMLRDLGRAAEAAEVLRDAAAAAVRAGDRWQEAMALGARAMALAVSAAPADDVIAECDRVLATLRDWPPEGPTGLWTSLGLMHTHAGRLDRARKFFDRAKTGSQRLGAPGRLAFATSWSGWAELIVGDLDAAEADLQTAYELCRAYPVALCLHAPQLGYVAALRGRLEEAEQLGLEGKHTAGSEDFTAQVSWRSTLALVSSLRSDHAPALALAEEAVEIARAGDWTLLTAERLADLGRTLRRAGDEAGCTRAFAQAAALYEAKGSALCLERLYS